MSDKQKCPTCNGRGWYWIDTGIGTVKESCNPCRGTGISKLVGKAGDTQYTPTLETITPAVYYRSDPAPTPTAFQDPSFDYCSHDHLKGNCRHKECPHYAPSPAEKPQPNKGVNPADIAVKVIDYAGRSTSFIIEDYGDDYPSEFLGQMLKKAIPKPVEGESTTPSPSQTDHETTIVDTRTQPNIRTECAQTPKDSTHEQVSEIVVKWKAQIGALTDILDLIAAERIQAKREALMQARSKIQDTPLAYAKDAGDERNAWNTDHIIKILAELEDAA